MKNLTVCICLLILGWLHFPNHLSAQCPTGLSTVTLILTTDADPQQTSLKVVDLGSNNVVFTLPTTSLLPNSTTSYSFCVPMGTCLKADLLDQGNDGGSQLQLIYNNQTYSAPSPFESISTVLAGDTTCTDISAIYSSNQYCIQSTGSISMGSGNVIKGSMLGNINDGFVCIGDNNRIDGWIKGHDIGTGIRNKIEGYKEVQLFGQNYDYGCGPIPNTASNQFGYDQGPLGNINGCIEDLPIPNSENNITLDFNEEMTINPGTYGTLIIGKNATLFFNGNPIPMGGPVYYTFEEIIVQGGALKPGGGGVLCDIFLMTHNLVIEGGAEIEAIINCELVEIGDNNTIDGKIIANPPPGELFKIGNDNLITDPTCPPCVNAKSGFVPPLEDVTPLRFWPNPTQTGEVQYSGPAGYLELYDMHGRRYLTHEIDESAPAADTKNRIKTQSLPSGVYIGRVTTASGRVFSEKLIVLGS